MLPSFRNTSFRKIVSPNPMPRRLARMKSANVVSRWWPDPSLLLPLPPEEAETSKSNLRENRPLNLETLHRCVFLRGNKCFRCNMWYEKKDRADGCKMENEFTTWQWSASNRQTIAEHQHQEPAFCRTDWGAEEGVSQCRVQRDRRLWNDA